MDAKEFTSTAAGVLVENLEGRLAFRPHPLYPALILTPDIQSSLSALTVNLGRLDAMVVALPDPKILIRSFVRREAQLSSYIENTYANYVQLARVEAAEAELSPEVIEAYNAERALLAGIDAVLRQGRPIFNSLIRQLQEVLLTHVRGHETRGRYRTKQVYIGNAQLGPAGARFVPPPAHMVEELMEAFEASWHAGGEHFALVRLAMLHYQFETIHPFEDGNGRVGRMLTLLGLCSFGFLRQPALNPSLHFERHRRAYYDCLQRVSTMGDWLGWIAFFLEGLHVATEEAIDKLRELLDLQKQYRLLIKSARNAPQLMMLVDHLFISPEITVNEAASVMGVSQPAAHLSVKRLLSLNILRISSSGRPMRYVAETILKAVNAEPTPR